MRRLSLLVTQFQTNGIFLNEGEETFCFLIDILERNA
jgi:hypothetical protein